MAPSRSESPVETITGLKDLLVDYAKQETIDPLRSLGRYLGFGVGGAVLVAFGLLLLALALLRGLQAADLSWMTGNLSFLPYLFTVLALGAAIAVLARLITGKAR